jgi:hypothetical protein
LYVPSEEGSLDAGDDATAAAAAGWSAKLNSGAAEHLQ